MIKYESSYYYNIFYIIFLTNFEVFMSIERSRLIFKVRCNRYIFFFGYSNEHKAKIYIQVRVQKNVNQFRVLPSNSLPSNHKVPDKSSLLSSISYSCKMHQLLLDVLMFSPDYGSTLINYSIRHQLVPKYVIKTIMNFMRSKYSRWTHLTLAGETRT